MKLKLDEQTRYLMTIIGGTGLGVSLFYMLLALSGIHLDFTARFLNSFIWGTVGQMGAKAANGYPLFFDGWFG